MSQLNQIWEQASARKHEQRYGYAPRSVTIEDRTPPPKPVARPAASVADILGFKPRRRCGLHST
jgi:hypothetical protein